MAGWHSIFIAKVLSKNFTIHFLFMSAIAQLIFFPPNLNKLVGPDIGYHTIFNTNTWLLWCLLLHYVVHRELNHARFLRRGRQPEETISRARKVLSPRFVCYSSLMEKIYLAM